jgi:hypothetical protein
MNLHPVSVALTCWALTLAAPVLAQGVEGGLFGATEADESGRNRLNVLMFMSEGLDSELPAELRPFVTRDALQSGGRSTTLAASADYARNRRSVQLFGNASTYFRHAQRLDRIAPGSQSAQLGAGVRLPKQGSLRMSQAAAYSPSYLYQLFPTRVHVTPGDAIPVNPEYRINETESYSHHTRMSLTFGSPRGTRLEATALYSLSDFKKQTAARPNLATYTTGAKVSRALSRRAAVSGGYEYSTGEFGFGALTKAHRVTLGVEYTPALSVTRRATFRLDVSPSAVEIPGVAERWQYPLQGAASVEYPFRLKWQASASYRRAVDFVPVLTEPLFTTGVRIKVIGVIGRRLDVSALAGSATAVSAISRNTRNLSMYTGEARIRYALTRAFALYSEYLYYSYDLSELAHLAPGLPGVYEQHGIRVGFMVFGQPLGR